MPPPVILDPAGLSFDEAESIERVRAFTPQRHEFQLLDRVIHFDRENKIAAGYHDVREDGWWARGHIPGRPIFPGVLMIEIAAQLASYVTHCLLPELDDRFIGFGGVDAVKFRGAVVPPSRFVVVGQGLQVKTRRSVCLAQGFVDNVMVFEAKITGMPV